MFVSTNVILAGDSSKKMFLSYKLENLFYGTKGLRLCSIGVGQGMTVIYKYRRKRNCFVDEKIILIIHRKNF